MPKKAKTVKAAKSAKKVHSFELVRFSGVAELIDSRKGGELQVYATFEQAVEMGVPVAAAAFAFRGVVQPGSAPGACTKFIAGNGAVRCMPDHCEGTCHLFSVPKNWKFGDPFKDEGLYGDMDPERIYFCSCTDKPIVY